MYGEHEKWDRVEKSIVLMMTVEITTVAVIALTDEILMAKVNLDINFLCYSNNLFAIST